MEVSKVKGKGLDWCSNPRRKSSDFLLHLEKKEGETKRGGSFAKENAMRYHSNNISDCGNGVKCLLLSQSSIVLPVVRNKNKLSKGVVI